MLPHEYFQHFALFAVSIRLFLNESISPSDLKKGKVYLDSFCKKFGDFYGEQYMGINIHSLLHLSSTVEEMGPLWAYSCFSFEGFNGGKCVAVIIDEMLYISKLVNTIEKD